MEDAVEQDGSPESGGIARRSARKAEQKENSTPPEEILVRSDVQRRYMQ
jgi:hypothetical protein